MRRCPFAEAGPGQAGIVVRATSCAGVSIGQSPAQPTVVSQIGINLVPPDGTGNINNYTVIYVTNNQALAGYFQIAGLPAIFDPQLTYEYSPPKQATTRVNSMSQPAMSSRLIFYSVLRPIRHPIRNRASWRTAGSPVTPAR
jgi:hypothetical protein